MSNRTIKIRIGKDGKVNVEVDGVEGEGCTELTKGLIESLGQKESEILKPEFWMEGGQKHEQFN